MVNWKDHSNIYNQTGSAYQSKWKDLIGMRLFIVQCKGDIHQRKKWSYQVQSLACREKNHTRGWGHFPLPWDQHVAFSINSLSLPFSVKNYLPFLECYSFSASSKLISFPSSPQKDLVWKSQNTRSKPRTQVIPIKILRRKQELMTQ